MIKRIIFDLDNTLIEWKEEYWNSINKALDICAKNYNYNDFLNIKKAVNNFESEYRNIQKRRYVKMYEKIQ